MSWRRLVSRPSRASRRRPLPRLQRRKRLLRPHRRRSQSLRRRSQSLSLLRTGRSVGLHDAVRLDLDAVRGRVHVCAAIRLRRALHVRLLSGLLELGVGVCAVGLGLWTMAVFRGLRCVQLRVVRPLRSWASRARVLRPSWERARARVLRPCAIWRRLAFLRRSSRPAPVVPRRRPLARDCSRSVPQRRPLARGCSRSVPQRRPLARGCSRSVPQRRPLARYCSRAVPRRCRLRSGPGHRRSWWNGPRLRRPRWSSRRAWRTSLTPATVERVSR